VVKKIILNIIICKTITKMIYNFFKYSIFTAKNLHCLQSCKPHYNYRVVANSGSTQHCWCYTCWHPANIKH